MGYYIQTPHTSFAIRTADLSRFFDLVSNLMSDENVEENGHGGSYANGGKTQSWYSWVSTENVRKAVADRDIVRIFEEWGYELVFINEENGESIYRLDIRGGDAKIGDEETFFAAIAPVVTNGSFLDVRGEDGAEWRWMWENGKFYSQDVFSKTIHFGEPNEIVFQDANKTKENA
jgi:hypothetical protein